MTKQIQFVCQGNSIRSIIAEAIFNKLAPKGMKAISAGTLPMPKIDPKTIEVLSEINIPPSKNSPTHLEFEDIESSDLVILMNKNIPNFPELAPKEKIIQWNIVDVVGKPVEEYKKTRDMIIEKVKDLITSLE